MTVKDLIEQLQGYSEDLPVRVFVEGNLYPALCVSEVDDEQVVEIGCGWATLDCIEEFEDE
ncbi:MAG: hypothetical protein LAT68_15825 [Cyclobacteriaceae bacterium]|nr:hypothetical protein [Cyclobacteriaceae bacterium]